MRRFLPLALCASLSGCAALPLLFGGAIPAPASVANQTTLDEKLGIAVTDAYTAASTLGYTLAKNGLIDKAQFKLRDQQGYDAVVALRAAYLAGNSTSYITAIAQAQQAVSAIAALVRK